MLSQENTQLIIQTTLEEAFELGLFNPYQFTLDESDEHEESSSTTNTEE